ncbi:MAG: hypothetical protein M1305_07995, partial [Candidatus Marsarchaeota archaeon]|nr:hypothetical protein [Candidatus Marsarchaeota archaeon]
MELLYHKCLLNGTPWYGRVYCVVGNNTISWYSIFIRHAITYVFGGRDKMHITIRLERETD